LAKLRFFCPKCGQRVRPDSSKFKCRHQGTPLKKGILDDDEFLLDEISVEIITEAEK